MCKIYEFDPVIYPTKVWISIKPDIDDLDEVMYALDDDGETLAEFPKDTFDANTAIAETVIVQRKSTNEEGCLVAILRPREMTPGVAGHEASHCTDWLCDTFGIYSHTFETGEARSYYLQWAEDSIWDVLHNPAKVQPHLIHNDK